MATTMKDISKKTGLGLATISKYMNGGNVLPENKTIIEHAIEELDYSVNEIARGLKTRRTKTIGVVVPELDDNFFTQVIKAMEVVLKAQGYAVIINDCQSNKQIEIESIQFLLHKKVDGIVSFPVSSKGKHLDFAIERNVPVLLVDRLVPRLQGRVDSISVNNVSVSREATRFLIGNGHKNIGIIVGAKEIYTSERRLQGYVESMEEHGLNVNPNFIVRGEYSVEGGFKGFKKLMAKNADITAVYATNHDTTLGVLMAANESNMRIGEDISLVGFDSVDWAKIIKPSLTIVTQPIGQLGRQAAEIMLRRLHAGKDEYARQELVLSARLSIGNSVKNIAPPQRTPSTFAR
ncbi:MAG: LacI family transcriptional regulator [Clostridiales Family XIII bacterium]|jgi:LacI family transcriptional regulator|nr:LacI family transcriptional regulator [Clostridiales Family XIII bacterium]